MILYNTLMGWAAAVILLTAAFAARTLAETRRAHTTCRFSASAGAILLTAGTPLTFLSATMAVTWPLTANPPINIAFAEPCLVLGVIAVVVGGIMVRAPQDIDPGKPTPMGWLVGALAPPLAAIAAAVLRFNLVGDAPAAEPVTGQIHGWENTTFALVYLAAAAGCACVALRRWRAVQWLFAVAGVFFLLFSSLNYYTHIGLLVNLGTGSGYQW